MERTRRNASGSRVLFWLLSAVLTVAGCIAWISLGIQPEVIDWRFILCSALLVLPTLATVAAEYWLIGRMNGLEISKLACFKVSLTGTALNLMPIPGQAAARVGDLVSRQIPAKVAAKSTLKIALLWCAWSFLTASIAAAALGNNTLTLVSLFIAALSFVASVSFLSYGLSSYRWIAIGSGIELISVTLTATRLWLVFKGLNLNLDLTLAFILSTSNVAAALVGVVPGGLGLREALAGLIAIFLSVDPVSVMLVVGITRAVGLVAQGCISIIAIRAR